MMVGGHVLATRGPTWFLGHLPADFSSVAFSMDGLRLAAPFFVYYVVFPSAAAYHSLYGVTQGTCTCTRVLCVVYAAGCL
jgi:hypothetical protein